LSTHVPEQVDKQTKKEVDRILSRYER